MSSRQSISDRLLPYLQREMNDTGVYIADTPVSLSGGNETQLYRFRLTNVPHDLLQELVLRIYPESQPGRRAVWESALHRSLSELGLPVPIVYFTGADTDILGAPFIIMELMDGRSPVEGGWPFALDLLGSAQARLHKADAASLVHALQAQGMDVRDFYPETRLTNMKKRVARYPWVGEVVQWLIEHCPPQPDNPSICHDDFHPLNLLEQNGKLTAILDWSNFAFGYPSMDVAFTTVILTVNASPDYSEALVDSLMQRYYDAYAAVCTLDNTHIDYFRVFRATMALIEGADGQSIWKKTQAIQRIRAIIKEVSSVEVSVPD